MSSLADIESPSPNHDERALPISMIVLHYTGMPTAEAAIERLADPDAKVSAHYVVGEDGTIVRMVDEERRAWHAGRSYWRGITDVNSASVGVEIVNPGHEFGYRDFPREQMAGVARVVGEVKARHDVPRANVVGHSDVAPARKMDPGEKFDWPLLAKVGLAVPIPEVTATVPPWTDAGFMLALERYGYDIADPTAAVRAFQRRFRPALIDGVPDLASMAILMRLLLDRERGVTR